MEFPDLASIDDAGFGDFAGRAAPEWFGLSRGIGFTAWRFDAPTPRSVDAGESAADTQNRHNRSIRFRAFDEIVRVAPGAKGRGDIDYDAGMKPFVNTIALALALTTLTLSAQTRRARAPAARKPFTVVEATIPEMRTAMEQGRVTSRELVQQYLTRIATYEDRLHAAITVNPDALKTPTSATASGRRERSAVRCTAFRSRLKDNIHTTDMPTTGGALAFDGSRAALRGDAHEEPAARPARSSSPRPA